MQPDNVKASGLCQRLQFAGFLIQCNLFIELVPQRMQKPEAVFLLLRIRDEIRLEEIAAAATVDEIVVALIAAEWITRRKTAVTRPSRS